MQLLRSNEFMTWVVMSCMVLGIMLVVIVIIERVRYNHKMELLESNCGLDKAVDEYVRKPYEFLQSFFEVLITNAYITLTIYLYYIMERHLAISEYSSFWLLVLIALSILFNNVFDSFFWQETLSEDDKGTLRLMCSLSIWVILFLVRILLGTRQYDDIIMCYTCLVLGRFIYFDTIIGELKRIFQRTTKFITPLIIA